MRNVTTVSLQDTTNEAMPFTIPSSFYQHVMLQSPSQGPSPINTGFPLSVPYAKTTRSHGLPLAQNTRKCVPALPPAACEKISPSFCQKTGILTENTHLPWLRRWSSMLVTSATAATSCEWRQLPSYGGGEPTGTIIGLIYGYLPKILQGVTFEGPPHVMTK